MDPSVTAHDPFRNGNVFPKAQLPWTVLDVHEFRILEGISHLNAAGIAKLRATVVNAAFLEFIAPLLADRLRELAEMPPQEEARGSASLTAALYYFDHDCFVVPCCVMNERGECTFPHAHTSEKSIGKVPILGAGWQHARLTREDIIHQWTQHPTANVGVLLEPSELIVVDLDSQEATEEASGKGLPPGPQVRTGRGVQHYFRNPKGIVGLAIKQGTSRAIDLLSKGIVVGFGSIHRTGKPYELLTSWEDWPLEDPPLWAEQLLLASLKVHSTAAEIPDDLPAVDLAALQLPQWLSSLIIHGQPLRPSAPYPSRSEAVWAAVTTLVEAGHDTDTIASIVLDARYKISAKPREQGARWVASEIGRARAKAHTKSGNGTEPGTRSEPAWPVLAEEALYGLAGDIVKVIDPYTEADKVAVLITLLAMFGNCVNASAHFLVEYTQHFVRLFVTLVGRTAKGRKGQSLSTLRYIFEQLDRDWSKDRIVLGGLSSGEGVIDAVRDARLNEEGDVIDRGEPDKRLLLIEEELVSALKVASREGNTLSAILRQAWDRGDLRPLTKNNKMRATGAHISIIAHITQEELLRYLTATEQSNGFGNRFIWLLVRRSKLIARPVPVPLDTLTPLIDRLRTAVDFTRKTQLMDRDSEAEARWEAVYPSLSEGKPGLFGAIIGRAEVQVMRLACLYALLDCSTLISVVHLEAALALWDYAEESARLIFSDQTGDPAADRLLEALRATPGGLSDKTINTEVFTRNKPATELTRLKLLLASLGLIHSEPRTDTGGRPETVWKATN